MPSPFPGMDPFIEGQVWEDFHHGIISSIQEALIPNLRPRYVVRVERWGYVEEREGAPDLVIRPDVSVLEDRPDAPRHSGGGTAVVTAIAPVVLTIRERETREIVTVMELLSPVNKHP